MYSVFAVGPSLAKRFVEDPPQLQRPGLGQVLLFLANFILFLPVFLVICYTLPQVYTTLAAVEDPLPDYEPVSLGDDNDDGTPKNPNDPISGSPSGRSVTSSLRATNRLLRSAGGWRANFRGLGYAVILSIVTLLMTGFIGSLPFVPFRIAHLITLLVVAPLSTVWVHAVITTPAAQAKSLSSRIRPARTIYAATWFPIFLFWAAANAAVVFPGILARLIGLSLPEVPSAPGLSEPGQHTYDRSDVAKAVCVLGVSLALQVLLVVPAHVTLTRVQASLLPADEDALVPFDRSFGGRIEPEVISGKGFATFGAAFKTVPLAGWGRIYLQRVKIFFVSTATYLLIGMVLAVQLLLLGMVTAGSHRGSAH